MLQRIPALAAAAILSAALGLSVAVSPASAQLGAPADVRPEPLPGDPKLSDYSAPKSDSKVTVTPIDFEVENLLEPGSSYTLRGFLYEPAGKRCRTSIVQANHALTTGAWYWDIPFEQQKYSIARKVARSGIPFLALNKLGYGQDNHPFRASDKPANGKTVTIQALAFASHQVTQQLRAMGYDHVTLLGHSAGSEESEIAAGMYQDVDGLILSGFTHLPTPEFTQQFVTKEGARAMAEEYPYFFGDISTRDSFLFTDFADPKLVKALHPLVNNTPSGEILSIGPQPSKFYAPLVTAAVLTLIANEDRIFSAEGAALDEPAFVSSGDVTFIDYDKIGHGVEFHRNGPEVTSDVVNWLKDRPEIMPSC